MTSFSKLVCTAALPIAAFFATPQQTQAQSKQKITSSAPSHYYITEALTQMPKTTPGWINISNREISRAKVLTKIDTAAATFYHEMSRFLIPHDAQTLNKASQATLPIDLTNKEIRCLKRIIKEEPETAELFEKNRDVFILEDAKKLFDKPKGIWGLFHRNKPENKPFLKSNAQGASPGVIISLPN